NQPVLDTRYLHGAGVDQVLAQESAGNVEWHLTDHLGTIRDLVNNSGAVVNHFVYDSFGQVISESNPVFDTRYLFTGREFDQEIGLYYYRARYYDASTGRFLSEDPIAFNGGDANLYRYVMNDPVAKTDSTGLIWDTIADIGFILYDIYRIGKDNIFGNCDNLGENLTSLGLDAAGTLIPFATGLGAAGRAATHADDVAKAGKTVLGHYPEYKHLADSLDARNFNIPENIWNKMSDAERWTANQKFLDRTISKGDEIILATPLDKVRPGSYYAKELEYLASKGYKPSADGTKLIPPN
ncbi:MAG: RHS repeat domain-containing protein, partial [Dolichospermum sp.]